MKDARGSGAGKESAGKALSPYPLTLEEVADQLVEQLIQSLKRLG